MTHASCHYSIASGWLAKPYASTAGQLATHKKSASTQTNCVQVLLQWSPPFVQFQREILPVFPTV